MENHRDYYRIQYREQDQPMLVVGEIEMRILNLSETGACCFSNAPLFDEISPVPIQVRLKDGNSFSTTATLIRREPDRLVVRFSPPIPRPIIFAEQRRLRHLYQDGQD